MKSCNQSLGTPKAAGKVLQGHKVVLKKVLKKAPQSQRVLAGALARAEVEEVAELQERGAW